MTLRTSLLFAVLLVSVVAHAEGVPDHPPAPPETSGLTGELHLGLGMWWLNETSPQGSFHGLALLGDGGVSLGYRLNSSVAPVALFNIGVANLEEDTTAALLLFGGGVKLDSVLPAELTLGAGFAMTTNGPFEKPMGLGLIARVSRPFPGHSFGPFLQLEGDVLTQGVRQATLALGVQFDFF